MVQTCVIGGWTEPRGSRPFFGSLLLGVYDSEGQLKYVGQSGAGFSDAALGHVWKRLHACKTRTCPFATVPRTSRRTHWVKPRLVVDVRFTGWTSGGKLRRPAFQELRTDTARAHALQDDPSGAAHTTR